MLAVTVLAAVASAAETAPGPRRSGTITLWLDAGKLRQLDLRIVTSDGTAHRTLTGPVTFQFDAREWAESDDAAPSALPLRLGEWSASLGFATATRGALPRQWLLVAFGEGKNGVFIGHRRPDGTIAPLLRFNDVKVRSGPDTVALRLEAGEVVITRALAGALGDPVLEGETIGAVTAAPRSRPLDGRSATIPATDSHAAVNDTAGVVGPDVIVGDVSGASNYGSTGDIAAFSFGTTSCNAGDRPALWVSNTPEHPVIAQNVFRLKDGRFEQIGQSWLKHGFFALSQDFCGLGCIDTGRGDRLGVGCSDPYSSSLNGNQALLGPKSEVNAYTGVFPYPPRLTPPYDPDIGRRVQIHHGDLDPARDGGGLYFAEAQYVTRDDAAAGHQDNNVSYRPIVFNGSGSSWTVRVAGFTQRERPALRAWRESDPSVVETEVRVPGEGLFLLAARAEELDDGGWRYEYALQNINSDRSAGSFRVPLAPAARLEAIGFHDVDYHSGEPFDPDDWTALVADDAITWSTRDYAVDPDANALRWGTLYNFRFEADIPPADADVTIGLFKPGDPSEVAAMTIGPAGPPPICGDGEVQRGEECDPPDGIHCDEFCQWICGDNLVQSGEDCDPPDGMHCDDACQWICGDGVVQDGETCDDGGESPDCDADCTAVECGDGTLNATADEECDDGGETAECDGDCTIAVCGDGTVNETAGEHCDPPDGVTCSEDCRRLATCGDGIVDPEEDCEPPGTGSCDATCHWRSRAHDQCSGAIPICPGEYTSSTLGAGRDGAAGCGASDNSPDVWYSFRPAATGHAIIDTCGSGYDTVLSLHGGCPGTLSNQLDCNDDTCALQSRVSGTLSAGTTYLIRVSGYNGSAGDFTLTLSGPACECEVDADCADSGNSCTRNVCADTACVPASREGPCDDEDFCTVNDTCSDGMCVGSGPPPPCIGVDCTDCNANGVRDDCEGLPDCDGNGVPDECEFADCNENGVGDVCDIAEGISADCDGGPAGVVLRGAFLFDGKCVNCHGPRGVGDFGPPIQNTPRTRIWDMLLPPTTHPGGAHPEYSAEDFAGLEAYLSTVGGGARPDRVPDECQAPADCDEDSVSDGCELAAGTQFDLNLDGTPDDCECVVVDPPAALDAGRGLNRFISVHPGNAGRITALRVLIAEIEDTERPRWRSSEKPEPPTREIHVRWVGPPAEYEDGSSAEGAFTAAGLQCEPHFMDWGAVGPLYVYGEVIRPASVFHVQATDETCAGAFSDPSSFSSVLIASTGAWGDVARPFATLDGPPQPDQEDIAAVLDKFADIAGTPLRVQTALYGASVDPSRLIDVRDIALAIDAYRGLPYPYPPPSGCR